MCLSHIIVIEKINIVIFSSPNNKPTFVLICSYLSSKPHDIKQKPPVAPTEGIYSAKERKMSQRHKISFEASFVKHALYMWIKEYGINGFVFGMMDNKHSS